MNHSYEDCDYFVSMAKTKNHEEMGITICIKNLFGITPNGLYHDREHLFDYGTCRHLLVRPPNSSQNCLFTKAGGNLRCILVDILGFCPVDRAIADGIVVSMVGW